MSPSALAPKRRGRAAPASACRTRRAICRPRRQRSCAVPPTAWPCACAITTTPCTAAGLPGSPLARAVFEAVEQARVEALGARRMTGVAGNLAAMLDEQYRRQGFERITERTESTMAEAVRLLTREALTHEPPPPAARRPLSICGGRGSNRASPAIWASSTARYSTRTITRGSPAACCRISTSISARSRILGERRAAGR